VFKTIPATLQLDTGRYMIVTGIRNNDGSVNTHLLFFVLHDKEEKNIQLTFITKDQKPQSLGKIAPEYTFWKSDPGKNEPLSSFYNGKGLILAWIDPDREPTKHTMLDFQQLKESFEKWGGGIVFLLGNGKNSDLLQSATFNGLPQQVVYGNDNVNLLQQAEKTLHVTFAENYPVFLVLDAEGNILDYSSGYKIGRGEQIVKLLKYLK